MATHSHIDLTRVLGRAPDAQNREEHVNIRGRCITTGISVIALAAVLLALILY